MLAGVMNRSDFRSVLVICFFLAGCSCGEQENFEEFECPPTHELMDGECVCLPPEKPCRLDCDPLDDSCDRGYIDPVDCSCKAPGPNYLERLEVTPSFVALQRGESKQLAATGSFSDGQEVDVTLSVVWSSKKPSIASVTEGCGTVTGLQGGAAVIVASSGDVWGEAEVAVCDCPPCSYCDFETGDCAPGCLGDEDCPAGLVCGDEGACVEDGLGELRGLWVTRWDFAGPSDIEDIFENADRAGFNAVFLQVRGRADAYYASSHEPWAGIGGSAFGEHPGWDPLELAIEEGAHRGLDVHAWINTLPAWSGGTPPPESEIRHKVLTNPEWLMVDRDGRRQQIGDAGYIAFSPGIPEVVDHIVAVAADIVDHYPVHGLHLDYIRYLGGEFSHDPVSNERYEAALSENPSLSRADWQRERINEVVERVHEVVSEHPGVMLTAASWHNNNLTDKEGVPGTSGYRDYYQDAHAWLRQRTIDALIPMNYFRLDSNPSFSAMADDHLAASEDAGRHLYMGINVMGRAPGGWHDEEDPTGASMLENIAYSREVGAQGVVLFAYDFLLQHDLWDLVATEAFQSPQPDVPVMPWKACPPD